MIVNEAGKEFRRVVHLEPAGGICDESEGNGVTFGKAIEGEGTDGLDDFFLNRGIDISLGHAEP